MSRHAIDGAFFSSIPKRRLLFLERELMMLLLIMSLQLSLLFSQGVGL